MTDADLQGWIGREMTSTDTLPARPARFMQATLDRDPTLKDGDPLPPLWHWLYFLEAKRIGELGRDAHPKRGEFLPPVPLPRRMWAGGRFVFGRPLILGQTAIKRSRILSVDEKSGRTGNLCFVTVQHRIVQNEELALIEEHDIVYREDPNPRVPTPAPAMAPRKAAHSHRILPTEVMLFRYSALTFNSHRIHYDVDYAREVEGYDGLVVHGPLTATLLVDLACSKTRRMPRTYTYRGTAPITGKEPFFVEGKPRREAFELWARRSDGALAMSATAVY